MRIAVVAVLAVVACRALLSYTPLPGVSLALLALASLLGLAGWSFRATGEPRLRLRGDVFVGLALGLVLGLLSRLVW
jgi:hypothetical protein